MSTLGWHGDALDDQYAAIRRTVVQVESDELGMGTRFVPNLSFLCGNNILTRNTTGFTGADSVYANTSLLSISDPSLNRTHIFFQTASQNVQRYDFYGFGSAIVMTDSESLGPATPGTRLATWATEGYCTETVDVYYQEGNTSDVHYTSFSDSCQYSYGYTPDCYVTSTTTGDQVLPLVRTYGQNVKHLWKPSRAVISGLVIGGIVVLGLLVCCCCACMA